MGRGSDVDGDEGVGEDGVGEDGVGEDGVGEDGGIPDGDGDDDAGDGGDETHEVVLVRRSGGESIVEVHLGESVLEAAERAGLDLPFGCRRGACASCTGRLLAGDVEHRREPRALKQRHLRDGYVLVCIAQPRDDCRIEVGADVGGDLFENPWM